VNNQTKDISPGNRTVGPAIERIAAVVSQNKVLAYLALKQLVGKRVGRKSQGSGRQIRLIESLAVHIKVTSAEVNRVTGDGDDPLYGKPPIQRVAQDHDLGTLGRTHVQYPPVEEIKLGILKSGNHAHSHNSDGLNQEVADEKVTDEGTTEQKETVAELLQK